MNEVRLEVPEISRDGRLRGKVAVVTGAGSAGTMGGTGANIAVLFAAKGAKLVLVDIDQARAEHTLSAVRALGGEAVVAIGDITRADHCRRMIETAQSAFGAIDILVNNAAIAPGEQANTEELWDRIIDINLKGAKLMSDAVLDPMKAQGRGSIVHISSIAALAAGGGIAYSASKGGMVAMTKAQAYEYGPHGIRVNNVAPGHVAIPMGLNFKGWNGAGTDAIRRKRARASLLGTEGTGWDVAYAVLFLVSDEAAYITGHTLPVDGGTTAVMPIVMAERILTD
ncbi:SDR family NAD(P)-dependent oxidoreductase [Chelatococcus asaccharovorans]|uniref:NAD(P)-dependent dehydrogenase (Short-subunit alcohol dehydrogenase family) n=1 Tax=Chelatococcus asaccharovorans TaxID=28210 RepID=A0A2V3U8H2_9HYPH|nr:SDR family oxidoreductase [Chelatococcus asaccharovorans]MBS7705489.1 SDR family oxidoreductase [Chelatococcus asaccharovorans]PXW60106.1 NAD(P)-dependent dehydrogenase (short-subunit alcohol dehydrogenase family) [Chelatococcus asaccharovorans]